MVVEKDSPEIVSPDQTREPDSQEEMIVRLDGFRKSMEERLQVLTHKTSLLEQLFVKRIRDDQARNKAFDELYTELQEYKRNFLLEGKKPLLKSLLLLHDTIHRKQDAGGDVEIISEELVEVLHRQGVELMKEQPEKFEREFQQAVDTEPTDRQDEDNDVVRVVRHGFRIGKQVFRPQEVVIRKYSGSN